MLFLLILLPTGNAPAGTFCFAKNNFYTFEIPDGFGADIQQAQQKKACLILFPMGSNFDQSPSTLIISLEPLKSEKHFKEFIKKDLTLWKRKSKRIEIEPELTTSPGLNFEMHRIFSPSTDMAFMGRAYHQAKNQVLLISSSIKNEEDIPLYETVYKKLIMQIKKIDEKNIFSYLKEQADTDIKSPTAKDFDLRFINSIRASYLMALKSCGQKSASGLAIVRLSQNGQIQNWFDEKSSEKPSCLGQKMLGVQGTRAPFEPFHLTLNPSAF